jgi:hypothetical protein
VVSGAALFAFEVADGPISRVVAARRLREAADKLEAAQVEAAREAGATWVEIGACYGLTKQGAQQRFRRTSQEDPGYAAGAERKGAASRLPPRPVKTRVKRGVSAKFKQNSLEPVYRGAVEKARAGVFDD